MIFCGWPGFWLGCGVRCEDRRVVLASIVQSTRHILREAFLQSQGTI